MNNFFIENKYFAIMTINDYSILMVFWNLFLLFIPFLLFLFLVKLFRKNKFEKKSDKALGILLFVSWVLFMPNTAYLITDIRHLLDYCPLGSPFKVCVANAWMIMFFFIYSLSGWIFFVIFLSQMRNFTKSIFGARISLIFIVSIIPLMALGVLIGLVDRFNSWDIIVRPLVIFENMLVYITSFYYFRNFFIFTIGLYILYFLGDFLFKDKLKK